MIETMIEVGRTHKLKVVKQLDFGIYLTPFDSDLEILMPLRYVPEECQIGDELEAFVYHDSEDRLIATTLKPLVQVGEYAKLKVQAVETVGAFLDWGLPKDLFLPFAEQTRQLRPGQEVIVFVYLDKSARIAASMRLERHSQKGADYPERTEVELFIIGKTDLGYKAIVNGRYVGVLYKDEVFQPLSYGQKIRGFIKKVRSDGKIDLSLNEIGRKASDDVAVQIIEHLKKSKGFLAIDDKTSAEKIYELFGVSKKKYKIALGGLYKKRLIQIKDDGIYLVKGPSTAI